MGFRSRRRHKGGGGGGGGGHGGGGQAFAWTGEANGLQPGDDIGNRKSFKPVVVPPDDIGNRRDPDEEEDIPFDDVGNRIDANPTHEVSGILLDLDPKKRKRRAKGTQAPIERNGRYVVGGVNPIIAGGNRPPPPMPEESFEPPQQQQPREPREPREPRVQQQPQQQQQPRAEKKRRFEQVDGNAAQEVSEKRAQRFFDFDEDDRFEYALKSTPEQKRKEALRFVDDILRECGRNANVHARVIEDGDKPKLLVTIEEKGPHARVDRLGDGANEPLFVMGNGALLSLNYLANKVVNRYPDDRIRLAVLPASDEPLYLESLDEHQKRKRAEAEGVPLVTQPVAVLVEAPVVEHEAPAAVAAIEAVEAIEAVAAVAAVVPVEAKAGGRRRKAAAAADVVEPVVEMAAPIVEAPVVVPAAVAAPAVAIEVEDDVPAKRGPRRKPKKAEEIIPPMVMPPPAPAAAPAPVAPVAPTASPVVAEPVAPAAEPEEGRGRRRAPPLDDLPPRPRPSMNDDPLGRGPPRGRPRRGPSMVEVVRVTKKT